MIAIISLITTIQVNLVPNPSVMYREGNTNSPEFSLKKFSITLLSQLFLGHLGFYIFSQWPFSGPHTLFTACSK